jgi:hypothetical protein
MLLKVASLDVLINWLTLAIAIGWVVAGLSWMLQLVFLRLIYGVERDWLATFFAVARPAEEDYETSRPNTRTHITHVTHWQD